MFTIIMRLFLYYSIFFSHPEYVGNVWNILTKNPSGHHPSRRLRRLTMLTAAERIYIIIY